MSTPPESLPAGLYLVATPIGNLGDITRRAVEVLGKADLVACEDTRVGRRLLTALGLRTPTTRYDDHVAEAARPRLLDRVAGGAAVALISDAGTPLVADPGRGLVAAARARGLRVVVVPGPSAAIAGLLASGLPAERFLFLGFLPARPGPRRAAIAAAAGVDATLVLFEAPHRLAATLADLAAGLGDRPAAVTRELTKLFEETRTDTLPALAAQYAAADAPRGEIVIVIGPPAPGALTAPDPAATLDDSLAEALATQSLRDAVAAVAKATGLPRKQVYARALALGPGRDAPP